MLGVRATGYPEDPGVVRDERGGNHGGWFMMYIDAVCKGIDEMPTIDEKIRLSVKEMFERDGIEALRMLLKRLDPVSYITVDLKNAKRIMHALEVCLMTGSLILLF